MKHIVFVHGIGDLSFKMAATFKRNMAAELTHTDIRLHTFLWKDLVSEHEEALKNKVARVTHKRFPISINIRDSFEQYIITRLRGLVIGYFGDAVSYLSETGELVRSNLEDELVRIAISDPQARISIVAHSLGSVITFDLLTSESFQRRMRKRGMKLDYLFTIGSPLALFVLRDPERIHKDLPIREQWINIYDNRDLVSSPLHGLYKQARDVHIRVQSANAVNSHIKYFDDPEVLNEILRVIY